MYHTFQSYYFIFFCCVRLGFELRAKRMFLDRHERTHPCVQYINTNMDSAQHTWPSPVNRIILCVCAVFFLLLVLSNKLPTIANLVLFSLHVFWKLTILNSSSAHAHWIFMHRVYSSYDHNSVANIIDFVSKSCVSCKFLSRYEIN